MPRRFWIGLGILLLVIIVFVGWSISRRSPMTTSSPPSVVQPSIPQPIARIGAVSGRWTKDGKAIFYVQDSEEKEEVFRYDLASQQVTRYTVPSFPGGFDISPDERSIVFTDKERLYIAELNSTTKRTIYTSPHPQTEGSLTGQISTSDLKWFPTNKIHFHIYLKDPGGKPLILDLKTKKTKQVPNYVLLAGEDGMGCIYPSYDDNEVGYPRELYLYDIPTQTSTLLPSFPSDFNSTNDLLYLTKDQLIYRYYPRTDGKFIPEFYRLDLHTMQRERWRDLPVDSFILNISPDLRYYFILAWGPNEPGGIWVYEVPPGEGIGAVISGRIMSGDE